MQDKSHNLKGVWNAVNTWRLNLFPVLCISLPGLPEHCPLGGLNNRGLVWHSSGGQRPKVKVWAGLAASGASLLGLQTILSLCPHMDFLLRMRIPDVSFLFKFLLFMRLLVMLDEGPLL